MTQLDAFLLLIGIGLAACAFLGIGILTLYLKSSGRRNKYLTQQRDAGVE
ncbi:hypothetical protein [Phyllobacterium salinisoli]|nr:hypothetical protein [Phyllobacterium salinisoli]